VGAAPEMATSTFQIAPAEPPFLEWQTQVARQRVKQVLIFIVLAILVVITAWRCGVNVTTFITGIRKGIVLVGMFFPPAWGDIPSMLKPMIVTLVLAMMATILGVCLSVPCALAASSNLAPAPLRLAMRAFIALERGLPEVVQILLLVAIFGLGIIPALVALSVSSIGMLAKLLADAIEEIRYAVIPQILPALLANGLFRFEFNVRAGVILGAIGGGGIGYVMSTAMSSMDYQRACMATLLTLVLVFATERVSDLLRNRILGGGAVR
jgi:phosphonate transport system permease protein